MPTPKEMPELKTLSKRSQLVFEKYLLNPSMRDLLVIESLSHELLGHWVIQSLVIVISQ